ncbi:MAG: sodium:solute symporter family protein [Candidatus Tyrphobacter sp.]
MLSVRDEVFVGLVVLVTLLGFVAARWRAADLHRLDEWALGGRRFGTLVSWFLIGGDIYTAYTFIAVPALVYGVGALGFYAVPYAAIAYPFGFIFLARFWSIAKARGYVTAADFVRDRFGSRPLEVAVALTGVLATLPYIALQVVGMKAVLMHLGGAFAIGNGELALSIAFLLLAAYTFTSGLRAPAMIAFVKDTLIYATVVAAIVIIPAKLGGWAHVFSLSAETLAARPKPGALLLSGNLQVAYATMALGSCLALFVYPHSITSVLAAKSKAVVQRNMVLLPIYSLMLGFLALLGYCAIAAGIMTTDTSSVVPTLLDRYFPGWLSGAALAAIVIGALVPAAIMAIGSANLFASNIFGEFKPGRLHADAHLSRLLTLALCAFALGFVIFVPTAYAINFQLLGGIWMVQIVPAFVLGLYTRKLHPLGLLLGWLVAMTASTTMAAGSALAGKGISVNVTLPLFGHGVTVFIALYGLAINLVLAVGVSLLLRLFRANPGSDGTTPAAYA